MALRIDEPQVKRSNTMPNKKSEPGREPLPPYISFKTFLGFIQKLKETAVPERIDVSLLRTYSGSVGRQLIAALRYLGLIEEGGRTTEKMVPLVKAYDTSEWQEALSNVIFDAYGELTGDLNLDVATPAQLEEKFRLRGAEGEVLQKCFTFYVTAVRHAGVTLSPHIVNRPRARAERGRSRSRRLPESAAENGAVAEVPSPQAGTVRFAFPIPAKVPATILVPADLESEDWEMIDSMIRAYIERRRKGT